MGVNLFQYKTCTFRNFVLTFGQILIFRLCFRLLGHCQIVEKRVLSQINEKIIFFMEIFALKVMFFPFFLLTLYAICTRVPMLNLLLACERAFGLVKQRK